MNFYENYDVIVLGGGHAGCEAALASARMGAKTLLLTISVDNIALMGCNPAIGGLGKGNLVKDLDALGGEMGKNADASAIQFRVLNRKKGSAVQSSRTQSDKYMYKDRMISVIMTCQSLTVKQAVVTDILIENGEVKGVDTACGQRFYGRRLVVCGGTFIDGIIYIGSFAMKAGRMYEPSAQALSASLKKIGFSPIRLKTDTPARVHLDSINTSDLEVYRADDNPVPFSPESGHIKLPQIDCWLTYTNEKTHEIIRNHIHESPFYNNSLTDWKGPRYCPSIEDKVSKFPEKPHHNIILEPEGLTSKEVHVNGFSASLPVDVQIAAYRTVKGLENCRFTRPAYAIAYDVYQPTGLYATYETKLVKGLYFAGQLNGTSGYEEAAVQGFMAAVNAVLSLDNKEPFILGRDESYIGVLTDDIVTKGVDEPYRMFTSRGEYRLLLREDNAESRLIEYGYSFGLISKTRYDRYLRDKSAIEDEIHRLKTTLVKLTDENVAKLAEKGVKINQSVYAYDLLKRPEISYDFLLSVIGGGLEGYKGFQAETAVKYSGYIDKQQKEIDRFKNIENTKIPHDFCYDNISGLRTECAQRLKQVRPATLGQASRIPGVGLSAIAVLDVELAKLRGNVSHQGRQQNN